MAVFYLACYLIYYYDLCFPIKYRLEITGPLNVSVFNHCPKWAFNSYSKSGQNTRTFKRATKLNYNLKWSLPQFVTNKTCFTFFIYFRYYLCTVLLFSYLFRITFCRDMQRVHFCFYFSEPRLQVSMGLTGRQHQIKLMYIIRVKYISLALSLSLSLSPPLCLCSLCVCVCVCVCLYLSNPDKP